MEWAASEDVSVVVAGYKNVQELREDGNIHLFMLRQHRGVPHMYAVV